MSGEDISHPHPSQRLDATATSMFGPVAKWGRVEFPLPEYRAPEHGRDELAAVVKAAVWDRDGSTWLTIADAIIAAGWTHR
jgi:hypothetical protein